MTITTTNAVALSHNPNTIDVDGMAIDMSVVMGRLRPKHRRALRALGAAELVHHVVQLKRMGRDDRKVVDALRIPVLLKYRELNGGDVPTKWAHTAILATAAAVGEVPVDEGCVHLSQPPTVAEGRRPMISNRMAAALPTTVVQALDTMAAVPLSLDRWLLEVILKEAPVKMDDRLRKESARVIEAGNRFYNATFVEWRGRVLTDTRAILSYQGDEISRALVQYADPQAVTKDDLRDFGLWIHAEFGVRPERAAVICDDPHAWLQRTTCAKPWKALAAIHAYAQAQVTGESRYIWQQDATASGFQIMSLLMKDPVLASAVSLMGEAGDLYLAVLNRVAQQHAWLNEVPTSFAMEMAGESEDTVKHAWRALIRKELAKPTVMLTGYGSASDGIALTWLGLGGRKDLPFHNIEGLVEYLNLPEDEQDVAIETHLVRSLSDRFGHMERDKMIDHVYELAEDFQSSLFEMYPQIAKFLAALRGCAQSYTHQTGGMVSWTTPFTGLDVELPGFRSEGSVVVEVSVTVGDGERHRWKMVDLLPNDGASALPPCFVHSLDAVIVIMMILRLAAEGINILTIHDSMGAHIAHAKRVQACFIEVVKELFGEDHLNMLLAQHGRPLVKMGDLTMNQVEGPGIMA